MEFGFRFKDMTGFREKEKGLLRKKGKVAQSVDNSTDCVDNLLTKRRAFADNAFALPCKDCAFTMVKRFGIEKISAVCANFNATLRLLSASGGSARGKERVFASLLLFLSIYLVEIMRGLLNVKKNLQY